MTKNEKYQNIHLIEKLLIVEKELHPFVNVNWPAGAAKHRGNFGVAGSNLGPDKKNISD